MLQHQACKSAPHKPAHVLINSSWFIIPWDWLRGCKYSAAKYIVWVTARLSQAPAPRPVGSELRCHSELFIRLHIHSRSITGWPPGPVTSLYVYYSVPPSPRRMIDVFGEQRGGTCALLLQSRLEGGRRLFHPHSDPESVTRRKRNNNSWWFVSQTVAGKLGAFQRVTISSWSGGFSWEEHRASHF